MNDFWSFSIFLLGVISLSGANVCYVADNSPFKVSCNLNETRTASVVWEATVNQTRVTLAHCTKDGCITQFGYASYFKVSSEWDITDRWILKSNLETPADFSSHRLYNTSSTYFSSYTNIACDGSNIEMEVCEKIEVYVNPQDVSCRVFDFNRESIFVICTVYTADPQLLFDSSLKYDNQTLKIRPYLNQSCRANKDLNDSSLFAVLCLFKIPFSTLGPGINELSIEASANTTDPDRLKVKSNVMRIPLKENLQNFNCSNVDSNMRMACLIPLSYTEINSTITLKSNESSEYIKRYDDVFSIITSTDGLITPTQKFIFRFRPKELQGEQEYRVTMSTVNSSGIMTEILTPWAQVDFYYPTWMNLTINGTSNDMIANVGDTVEILCSMNGYPEPEYTVEYNPFFFFPHEIGHRYLMTIFGFHNTGYLLCNYLNMERRINLLVRSVFCCNLKSMECPEQDHIFLPFVGNSLTIPVYGYPQPETMVLVNKSYSGDIVMAENVSIVYEAVRPFSGNIIITLLSKDRVNVKTTHFHLFINNGVGNGSILYFEMEGDIPWHDKASSSADIKVRTFSIFLLALMWIYQSNWQLVL